MLKIITSQLKVIPGKELPFDDFAVSSAMVLKNEPFSFQVIYSHDCRFQPIAIEIDSELPAQSHRIDCLPIVNAANDYGEPGYVTDEPALVPDILKPRPLKANIVNFDGAEVPTRLEENVKNNLNATKHVQAVLVTVNPDSKMLTKGKYTVKIAMRELSELEILECAELEIEIIDAALPEQDFNVTNWFHVDCLCDFYGCEPYSDRFYEIFKTFLRNMTRHRQNTLLLPAFTPALDTPICGERRNVQLVDISREGGEWVFGFDRLAKFMRTADECGIKYFEHCHLFTQWGAEHAPAIYGTDGNRLFGWDTDASSEEYSDFIVKYLGAYIAFARAEGYSDDRLIFHISDEPTPKIIETYTRASRIVSKILAPFTCVDALSEIEFYHKGLVKTPAASIENAEIFSKECGSFWVYYTCGTYVKMCSNRLVTNTAARTRVLGVQMYTYGARGFLHWGYNYYYDRMSEAFFDPKSNPCGYKMLPGCSYLAYPDRDGAIPSLREVHMREAFDDLRILKLLRELSSEEGVKELVNKELGDVNVHLIPQENALYALNQSVKRKIKEILNSKR